MRASLASPAVAPPAQAVTVAAERARAAPAPARSRLSRILDGSRWPLAVVLAAQIALSLRLVWSNTAFEDEALYLSAGHMEWTHWLYGVPIPDYAAYFSGSPVIYPPLGAYADAVAGLAGARILSLCFMLGATILLHGVTRRLFDRPAAAFAAALFAGLAATQFLGAFATYDAMALMLLALALWLGVRSAQCRPGSRAALMVASGATLALADAAKYASALFDPVIIAATALAVTRIKGRKAGIWAGTVVCVVLSLLIFAGLKIGGPSYLTGIKFTTLERGSGSYPAFGIIYVSAVWMGATLLLALIGVVVTIWSRPRLSDRLLALVLGISVTLVPAEQARIHTFTSLFKHVGYGAWFGAILAGCALSSFPRAVPAAKERFASVVSIAAVVVAAVPGTVIATAHFTEGWPSTSTFIARLQPWVERARDQGEMLFDNASIPEYYSPALMRWQYVINNVYFAYTDPDTGVRITQPPLAYADAIKHGYFALIALTYGNAPSSYDPGIRQDITRYGGYKLVVDVPYRLTHNRGEFLVWIRTAPS
jgi:hypothetical protein